MPKVGENLYPYTQEGIAQAEVESLETGLPISNAMERVTKEESPASYYEIGGMVKSMYEKGGKVK